MKRLIAVVLAVLIATPVFACGPMTGHSGGGGKKSRGGGGNKSSKRDQWTKKRVDELNKRRQDDEDKKFNANLGGISIGIGNRNFGDAAAVAEGATTRTKKQRQVDEMELLMLKSERGEASAEEQKKLAKKIRQWQREQRNKQGN